jgi:hypothetical protein
VLQTQAGRAQHLPSEALLLAKQAQQDVLGADEIVLELTRLLLRQDDGRSGLLCKPLKQSPSIPPAIETGNPTGTRLKSAAIRASRARLRAAARVQMVTGRGAWCLGPYQLMLESSRIS